MSYPVSWNQPPQFPAGVPPMPQGANIPATAWNKGNWVQNPNYRPTGQPPPAVWAPSQAWQAHAQPHPAQAAQQQQQQVYNPYKRQAKPPSADYLAQKISDNGLQLEGMQSRSALGWGDDLAPTPYIWNPGNLPNGAADSDEDEDEESSTDEESPPPSPSHRSHRPSLSGHSSTSRHRTDPALSSGAGNSRSSSSARPLTRHASEPPPDPSRSSKEGSRGYSSASQQAQAALNRSSTQRSSSASAASTTPQRPNTVPEAYTSRQLLKPTFSPSIIRTPDYYSHHPLPSRSGSVTPSGSSTPSRRSTDESYNSIGSSMDRMSMNSTPSSSTLGRQSSLPLYADPPPPSRHRPSISGPQQFVEEPTEILSPLIIDSTPKASSRPLGRGSSMPVSSSTTSVLSPIQEREARPSSSLSKPPPPPFVPPPPPTTETQSHRRSKSKSSRHSPSPSPYSSAQPSPVKVTPPGSAPVGGRFQITPPSSGGIYGHNPLPTAPQESSYLNGIYGGTTLSSASAAAAGYQPRASSSASAAAARQQQQQQQQTTSSSSASKAAANASTRRDSTSRSSSTAPTNATTATATTTTASPPSNRRRHGYWNKRGDHLSGEYIVYAPEDQAFPSELASYPGELEGFKNHRNHFIPYRSDRPELPDSLPQRGMPPKKPYSSFLKYVDRP